MSKKPSILIVDDEESIRVSLKSLFEKENYRVEIAKTASAALKKIKTTNGIINPEKIAETYLHLVNQHPSAWTFEMDIRSQNELAWWNSDSRHV